ncbi:MYB DNA-binding domain containing protein [Metarhizium rileyi]|uniref:MYB DNA-binding domain containing protein n=1 Tax=Metarhizium rileyi (strain RCEF 4871) TaxID=1649241 RepID=A0A162HSN2_METRR|nr:MYB DNA-binding domain containing protein [Metarhizium rileyi RCEF 4871]
MATIEPRLIHLLNEPTSTPQLHHADLPPLHALPLPTSTERPLPPLELDGAHRPDRPNGVSAYPLRMFLGDHEVAESSHGRSKPINDLSDASDDAYSKKRARNIHVKDDFVQLPQPMKRQKSAQQAPAMPPIINGLLEPPSHPALFPPILSSAYDDNDTSQIRLVKEYAAHATVEDRSRPSPENDKPGKSRKRAAKPRRKWSEEETKHLLLGVNRHGVGKWTSILEDPDFTFNDRTAGDLKDRFRTCCPEELRSSSKSSSQAGSPPAVSQDLGRRAKSGIHSENILIEDSPSPKEAGESDSAPKPRKSRAHRKKLEDLAEMGILGPFKKSHRRERRPFTEHDDREILEGLDIYGPAWTKIQRDARFNLSSRQPTDLRDRVRNKYPTIYHRIEKGTFNAKDGARSSNLLEPSVTTSIDSSLKRSEGSSKVPRSSHNNVKEDFPTWPLQILETSHYTQPPHTFDFGEPGASHFMGGEMDISRLLLDDSRIIQVSARHSAD